MLSCSVLHPQPQEQCLACRRCLIHTEEIMNWVSEDILLPCSDFIYFFLYLRLSPLFLLSLINLNIRQVYLLLTTGSPQIPHLQSSYKYFVFTPLLCLITPRTTVISFVPNLFTKTIFNEDTQISCLPNPLVFHHFSNYRKLFLCNSFSSFETLS
jgi:hypothetical protein